MNIYEFNHVLYKGNINRDFYVYCLKNNFKLIKYFFINMFYFLLSFIFTSKKDLYTIKKFKYLKEIKNLDKEIKGFYKSKKRFNNFFKFSVDTIIDRVPEILIRPLDKCQIIGYKLDNNFEVNLTEFNADCQKLNKVANKFIRNRFELKNINSNAVYLVHNNRMKNIKEIKINSVVLTLIIAIVISAILTSISFSFTNSNLDLKMYFSYYEIRLFFLNFLPIFLSILLFYFLFRRLHLSFLIPSLFILILGVANQTKLVYRDDIVKFEDISLVKEALIMTERYDIIIKKYTVIAILLIIIMFFLIKRYVPKLKCSLLKRASTACLLLIIMWGLYNTIYKNEELYDSLGDKSLINVWIDTRQYQIRGLLYPFIYTLEDGKYVKPDGYNEEEAKKVLDKYTYEEIPENEKVNIIAVMLEAYNDFSKFGVIDFNEDIYKKFHEIQDNSLTGNLVTDVFGGGTVSTERSFLTGFYDMPNLRKKVNSYVWYFKEQGYITESMHPIYGAFYNRNTTNINLGFDVYYNYENKFSSISSSFLEDYDFFDYIIEGYEEAKSENKPYFNFSVTYQNHGPYYSETYDNKEYFFENENYNEEAYNIINEYFTGIKKTNIALEKLINYFDDEDEPVIVIIFGDHNPYLGDGALGYNELGINMDISTIEGFLNYYETPYIIHGNNAAKEVFNKNFIGTSETISPIFLMNVLFNYCGLSGNQYMQYMNDLKNNITVINENYYKINDEFIRPEEIGNEVENLLKEYSYMNYYYGTNYNKNN